MIGFEYTIRDIMNATKLSRKYIDRSYEIMPFLKVYRKQSPENNQYFYNAGVFDIFHKIANLKKLGQDRRSIKEALEQTGLGNQVEEAGERGEETKGNAPGKPQTTESNPEEHQDDQLTKNEKLYERLLNEKDQRLEAVERTLRMLLPAGKTPDDVKDEREKKDAELDTKNKQVEELTAKAVEYAKRDVRESELIEEFHKPIWKRRSRKAIMGDISRLRSKEAGKKE